uniref:Uncharacterized protein n=1 Tax=Rangifer tarandus platyrhynchus TaxID=3082113 RepID=A0ACB0DZV4_RANTA|nr:unnamed protein product [Rangifer tarandus platyrhynchus]
MAAGRLRRLEDVRLSKRQSWFRPIDGREGRTAAEAHPPPAARAPTGPSNLSARRSPSPGEMRGPGGGARATAAPGPARSGP